uniref:Uncharacterized protein n=1 Tax=Panagrolaimus superbus TaxID=310955 RepID=A0A914YMS8_9BILA
MEEHHKGVRYADYFFLLAILFIFLIFFCLLCTGGLIVTRWSYKRRTKEKLDEEREKHRREEDAWKECERKVREEVDRKNVRAREEVNRENVWAREVDRKNVRAREEVDRENVWAREEVDRKNVWALERDIGSTKSPYDLTSPTPFSTKITAPQLIWPSKTFEDSNDPYWRSRTEHVTAAKKLRLTTKNESLTTNSISQTPTESSKASTPIITESDEITEITQSPLNNIIQSQSPASVSVEMPSSPPINKKKEKTKIGCQPKVVAEVVQVLSKYREFDDWRLPNERFELINEEEESPRKPTNLSSSPAAATTSTVSTKSPISPVSSTPSSTKITAPQLISWPSKTFEDSNDPFLSNDPYWRSRTDHVTAAEKLRLTTKNESLTTTTNSISQTPTESSKASTPIITEADEITERTQSPLNNIIQSPASVSVEMTSPPPINKKKEKIKIGCQPKVVAGVVQVLAKYREFDDWRLPKERFELINEEEESPKKLTNLSSPAAATTSTVSSKSPFDLTSPTPSSTKITAPQLISWPSKTFEDSNDPFLSNNPYWRSRTEHFTTTEKLQISNTCKKKGEEKDSNDNKLPEETTAKLHRAQVIEIIKTDKTQESP